MLHKVFVGTAKILGQRKLVMTMAHSQLAIVERLEGVYTNDLPAYRIQQTLPSKGLVDIEGGHFGVIIE